MELPADFLSLGRGSVTFATATVHHHVHCSSYCPFLFFDVVPCLQFFWFLPILSLVIAFGFVFFVTSLALSSI